MNRHRLASWMRSRLFMCLLLAFPLVPRPATCTPVQGFLETWPGTSTQLWGGGATVVNPGTGGTDGPGDGYLKVSQPFESNLGTRNMTAAYTGNWVAAGIKTVTVWLNDVGTDEDLEIHFSIGNTLNFWQYTEGFFPPENAWAMFTVDLTAASNFTQTRGTGTFENALTAVDRIHFRHDKPPYVSNPDRIAGDVGIDRLRLQGATTDAPIADTPAARAVELAPPYPNPSRGAVACALETFEPGSVRLEVVDAMGRIVRRAAFASAAAGPRLWLWDGRDDQGRRLPSGYYRVRALGPSGGTSRPVLLIE